MRDERLLEAMRSSGMGPERVVRGRTADRFAYLAVRLANGDFRRITPRMRVRVWEDGGHLHGAIDTEP
jgi:hypothetical protein